MKNLLLFLLLFSSCCRVSYAQLQTLDTPFGTATIEVAHTKAYLAKSAQVETKAKEVIVFLEGEVTAKVGLNVTVVSTAKFKSMFAIKKSTSDFTPLSTKSNGDFYFFGTPGVYTLILGESDPEKGISYSSVDGTIDGPVAPDPGTKPPIGNFDKLLQVTKQASDKMGDKDTCKALSNAYIKAVDDMKAATSVEICVEIARSYRRAVFAAIPREKRNLDWNSFVKTVDVEMAPFQTSVEAYTSALLAVAQTLSL